MFEKPEHSKKYVFLAKCIENTLLRENDTVNKIEENERLQPHENHDSYTFQAFKWTSIQVFHHNNRDFKSRRLFVGGERCPICSLWVLKNPCDGLFFPTSGANETGNLNIWSKLNQWAKIP